MKKIWSLKNIDQLQVMSTKVGSSIQRYLAVRNECVYNIHLISEVMIYRPKSIRIQ